MGKVFDELYGDAVMYYHGKKIPVRSLNLSSDYLIRFCRYMEMNRDWTLDGITYERIRRVRTIGDKKARAIAEALVTQGVEITDIPEVKVNEPTRLIVVGPGAAECTNCSAILTTNMDISQQFYRFCPMCGKKLKWEE